MKNPHPSAKTIYKAKEELDTDIGLPRKLGWKMAQWFMGTLQIIIIALLSYLISETIDQGKRVARIEGKLGIALQYLPPSTLVGWAEHRQWHDPVP